MKDKIDYPHVASGLVIAAAFIGLMALIFSTQVQAQTCDRDCTADGKRVVRAGQTFTGYAHITNNLQINFTTETWRLGWNLVSTPTSQCTFNIRDFGNTILCFN